MGVALGAPAVFDDRAVEGEGVAPLNVCALEVLAPSAVAFLRSALPPTNGATLFVP